MPSALGYAALTHHSLEDHCTCTRGSHACVSHIDAPDARKLLIALDKLANTDGHRDGTKYGLARTATRSFHAYHLCAISTAIVTAHAEILLQAADARAAAALRDTDLSGVSD